ncbi:LamG domain-containing protein [Spirosoma horti]
MSANTPTVGVTTAVNLTNLTPSTTYYYRAYAKLPSGQFVYSSTVETFTTLADPLLQDLIASISFTDQSLLDVSGYNNHVKLVDNPTFTTDHKGRANSAIFLDGVNDYFYMDESNSLNPDALSVSVWFKMSSFTHRMQIYNKSHFTDSANETYSALLKLEDDKGPNTVVMTNIKQNSNCQSGKGWQDFPVTSRIQKDTWYHLVFTYSGRSIQMYLNNVLLYRNDELPYSTMDKCPGAELKFGAAIQELNWFFHGAMDDIRIYKRALTAGEVDALYKQ